MPSGDDAPGGGWQEEVGLWPPGNTQGHFVP